MPVTTTRGLDDEAGMQNNPYAAGDYARLPLKSN
jgi:hypothetical protein